MQNGVVLITPFCESLLNTLNYDQTGLWESTQTVIIFVIYPCKDFHWHNASQRQIRHPKLFPKPYLKIMSVLSNKPLNSWGADKMSFFSFSVLSLLVKLICWFSPCSMYRMEITPAAVQHHRGQGRLGPLLESPCDNGQETTRQSVTRMPVIVSTIVPLLFVIFMQEDKRSQNYGILCHTVLIIFFGYAIARLLSCDAWFSINYICSPLKQCAIHIFKL